jgi:hypothetical protein
MDVVTLNIRVVCFGSTLGNDDYGCRDYFGQFASMALSHLEGDSAHDFSTGRDNLNLPYAELRVSSSAS